ncbi:MAG: hypothetical protein DMG83_05295 [Acidobacteria bacterium]|nr:MAG: hypothetical protein DMG83_05295 [Acidobacteriota bacterium]
MPKFFRSQCWLAIFVVCLLGQAFAQGGATGAITGTVQDQSGAVVANADIRIINQDTGTVTRITKTDATGSFYATLLPVATYTVQIANAGFREAKIPDVAVRVTETTRMTAKLVPLQVLEKVEVQALVQTVETTTATTGQAIESKTIRELPLATQNFEQLLTLSSGAQSELNASAQLGRGNVRVIVNGQREDNNNYLIEGISATDYNVAQATNIPLPNPDVIQEFKVRRCLRVLPQRRAECKRVFPESCCTGASGGETKHLRRQLRWAHRQGSASRFLLCELSRHTAAQRPFAGNADQHDAACDSRFRS